MYNLLSDVPSSTSSEISADAIQFLQAHVVQFVTELVHRAIVFREQERAMKEHTKVWKINPKEVRNRTDCAMHADHVLVIDSYSRRRKRQRNDG